jgi:hypothetical protein
MSHPFVERYKIPFLLAIVVALAVVVIPGYVSYIGAGLAIAGAIVGFLLVDLEYLIHAYLIDPSSEVSMKIKDFVAHRNFVGLIDYYNREEYTFGELSIRSAIFQVILTALALMTITNNSWIFARTMVLTMSATLLYFQVSEYIKTHTLQRWFWIYRGTLSDSFYKAYMVALMIIFVYQFTFL